MAMDQRLISDVFPSDICARISNAVLHHPAPNDLAELFHDLARIVKSATNNADGREPSNKKRKLDGAISQTNGATTASVEDVKSVFSCKDVSFQVPARKKLKLDIAASARDLRRQEIRLQNEKIGEVEYTLSADHIDQAFCLPVPEKQLRQWNFVLFPKPGALDSSGMPCEQVVFSMNEVPPAGACSSTQPEVETDTFVTVTERELNRMLHFQGKRVVIPSAAEFSSSVPQSHRKGEKAYHVKAHRGSKEGREIPHCPLSVIRKILTTYRRLPLFPRKWHCFRLQEASRFFPFRQHRIHQLHLRPTAHIQPRHCRPRHS